MKNTKILLYILIISGVLLILSHIVVNYKEESSYSVILGVILIIIPFIYTVLPIIKEYLLKINNSKNRLSSNTFTDRCQDLQNLVAVLSQEKVIMLTGKSSQCGKSWLVKNYLIV